MAIEKQLIVFGAGGHGKVIADVAAKAGLSVAGFADDSAALHSTNIVGLRVLGGLEWLYGRPADRYIVALGIGDNYIRMAVAESLISRHFKLATIFSPSAIIASSAHIGCGSVVMPGVVVNPDAVIGEGAILNTGAIVEHDVTIGQYAHISPNATLGGGAKVGDLTHIAIGATVLPSVRIGSRSIVGAGSIATRNIPDDVMAFGSPARVQRSHQSNQPKNAASRHLKGVGA